jgi:hypothetical protein
MRPIIFVPLQIWRTSIPRRPTHCKCRPRPEADAVPGGGGNRAASYFTFRPAAPGTTLSVPAAGAQFDDSYVGQDTLLSGVAFLCGAAPEHEVACHASSRRSGARQFRTPKVAAFHKRIVLKKIGEAGAGFRSLTEHIDTTTPAGRMMMQMVGAFAEFERAMIRERTR